jgi:hypothetical protein
MFVKPAHDDQRGNTAKDTPHLGKTDQLVVGRRWHRSHRRTVKSIVARTGKFVHIGTRFHTRTVARHRPGSQHSATGKSRRKGRWSHFGRGAFHLHRRSITVM